MDQSNVTAQSYGDGSIAMGSLVAAIVRQLDITIGTSRVKLLEERFHSEFRVKRVEMKTSAGPMTAMLECDRTIGLKTQTGMKANAGRLTHLVK